MLPEGMFTLTHLSSDSELWLHHQQLLSGASAKHDAKLMEETHHTCPLKKTTQLTAKILTQLVWSERWKQWEEPLPESCTVTCSAGVSVTPSPSVQASTG